GRTIHPGTSRTMPRAPAALPPRRNYWRATVARGGRSIEWAWKRKELIMPQPDGRMEVLADPRALAQRAAEWMTATALAAKGPCRVSLSGGSTPKALYELLASDQFKGRFPWNQVSWYWGDERFVPPDHPESNYRMAREAMLAKAPVPPENVH